MKARILEDGRESRAFSDVKMEILEVITRGEKVVVRWKASGTHTGTLKGIRPTGKRVTVGEIHIFRVVEGSIAEERYVYDSLDLYEQLDVVRAERSL